MSEIQTGRIALTQDVPVPKEGARLLFLNFARKVDDGPPVKFSLGVPVADLPKLNLTNGAKNDAAWEVVPGKDGREPWMKLKRWGDVELDVRPGGGGFKPGGGGGGGGRPQRTPEEAASIMAQTVAVQSAHMYAGILQSRAMQDPKATFDANEFAKIARAVSDAIADSFGAMLAKVKS